MNLDDMIPIAEYARLIGKATITVADKCRRGNLPGAVKIGRDWFVPKDAEYPDYRVKSGKYIDFRKNRTAKTRILAPVQFVSENEQVWEDNGVRYRRTRENDTNEWGEWRKEEGGQE